ncbi:MAG: hypothetical protein E6I04_05955, partial [Chloroflexi bacterium]
MFARWGRFVYRFRWATIAASGVLLAISIAFVLMGGTLTSGGPLRSHLEAFQASQLTNDELNTRQTSSIETSNFDLIFKSETMSVGDSAYKDAVEAALAPIRNDSRVVNVTTPYSVAPAIAA